jgi:hypothetical protein
MLSRRHFLGTVGAGLSGAALGFGARAEAPQRKRMAIVTTEWRYRSHAWHMAERFLTGYPLRGKWHRPDFEVVSAYVDQTPENDLSRDRAKEFGFKIYPTIAEALRCGGKSLAVDAVLLDVPCTGTGTLRRHPDGRWRIGPRDLDSLITLQAELLDGAGRVVEPGGTLVYATCSLEPEENEEQVESFLERHPDFEAVGPPAAFDAPALDERGWLRVLPQRMGVDGAFAARLGRRP